MMFDLEKELLIICNNEVKEISSGKYSSVGVNMLVCEDERGNVISEYFLDK